MPNGTHVEESSTAAPPVGPHAPPEFVRAAVRDLLQHSPAYQQLNRADRKALASAMVRVCSLAAALIHEEADSQATVLGRSGASPFAQAQSAPLLAEAQARRPRSAQGMPQMAGQIGQVTRSILNAVSFPRFVTELINGVFKAMIDSSIQQMHAYVDLLNNVAASTEDFADANVGPEQARSWLTERYPGTFEVGSDADTGDGSPATLRLREGASLPSANALRVDLGLDQTDPTPSGDPEHSLVPLARRQLARNRQQVLASMVMLGIQRIVIDSGQIRAAMRFHIDTRDAESADQGSIFNLQNQVDASGEFRVGVWGASAHMTNTIGYVSTQRSQNTHEMNTDLDLTSSVDINFRSDYLPLNRLASPGQVQQIQANTRNPGEEAAETARTRRLELAHQGESARRAAVEQVLRPAQPPPISADTPGSPQYTHNLMGGSGSSDSASGGAGSSPASGGSAAGGGSNVPTGHGGGSNALTGSAGGGGHTTPVPEAD